MASANFVPWARPGGPTSISRDTVVTKYIQQGYTPAQGQFAQNEMIRRKAPPADFTDHTLPDERTQRAFDLKTFAAPQYWTQLDIAAGEPLFTKIDPPNARQYRQDWERDYPDVFTAFNGLRQEANDFKRSGMAAEATKNDENWSPLDLLSKHFAMLGIATAVNIPLNDKNVLSPDHRYPKIAYAITGTDLGYSPQFNIRQGMDLVICVAPKAKLGEAGFDSYNNKQVGFFVPLSQMVARLALVLRADAEKDRDKLTNLVQTIAYPQNAEWDYFYNPRTAVNRKKAMNAWFQTVVAYNRVVRGTVTNTGAPNAANKATLNADPGNRIARNFVTRFLRPTTRAVAMTGCNAGETYTYFVHP